MLETRSGLTTIHDFPPGEIIVSMIDVKGRILVATTPHVYEVVGNSLRLLRVDKFEPPQIGAD